MNDDPVIEEIINEKDIPKDLHKLVRSILKECDDKDISLVLSALTTSILQVIHNETPEDKYKFFTTLGDTFKKMADIPDNVHKGSIH